MMRETEPGWRSAMRWITVAAALVAALCFRRAEFSLLATMGVCAIAVSGALYLFPKGPTIETVTAIRGLGIQQSVITPGGRRSVEYLVPAVSIAGIIINEGIQHCDVRYYMGLVVRGRPTLQLMFTESRPRLPVLAIAHRELTLALGEPAAA